MVDACQREPGFRAAAVNQDGLSARIADSSKLPRPTTLARRSWPESIWSNANLSEELAQLNTRIFMLATSF
jgi:hypothetical protein